MPAIDPAILVALRLALAFLFLRAAIHKLRDRAAFRDALAGYDLLPRTFVGAATFVLPAMETIAAVLLVAPTTGRAGAFLSMALLGLYSGAIALSLARGRDDVACGCGGPAGELELSGGLLVRNAILLGAAVACAAATAPRPPSWIDAVTIAGGAAVFTGLHAAAEHLLATAPRRAALRGHA